MMVTIREKMSYYKYEAKPNAAAHHTIENEKEKHDKGSQAPILGLTRNNNY